MELALQKDIYQGLGALALLQGKGAGLGVAGPYGDNPAQVLAAGPYEISGTQVALRATAGGAEKGRFNNEYGDNGGIVVGTPDQVEFDGQTGTAMGLTWGHVKVTSGALAGLDGFVAVKYMAPVGWTKDKGYTEPAPRGGGGGGEPVVDLEKTRYTDEKNDYTPWILGGVGVLALGVIGFAVFGKKKKKKKA